MFKIGDKVRTQSMDLPHLKTTLDGVITEYHGDQGMAFTVEITSPYTYKRVTRYASEMELVVEPVTPEELVAEWRRAAQEQIERRNKLEAMGFQLYYNRFLVDPYVKMEDYTFHKTETTTTIL